jgi:hypothetical protein
MLLTSKSGPTNAATASAGVTVVKVNCAFVCQKAHINKKVKLNFLIFVLVFVGDRSRAIKVAR